MLLPTAFLIAHALLCIEAARWFNACALNFIRSIGGNARYWWRAYTDNEQQMNLLFRAGSVGRLYTSVHQQPGPRGMGPLQIGEKT